MLHKISVYNFVCPCCNHHTDIRMKEKSKLEKKIHNKNKGKEERDYQWQLKS